MRSAVELLPPSPDTRRTRVALVLLAIAFLTLAGLYSMTTPAYETPDEPGHIAYVLHLMRTGSFLIQGQGEVGEAHQPPLYYLLAALVARPANLSDLEGAFSLNERFMWAGLGGKDVNAALHHTEESFPFRGQALALHLMRVASVLMGLVTILLTAAIGLTVFPERPLIGLLGAALVGFNPQFLFISGAVNNDNLLAMLATAAWLQLVRILDRPEQRRRWFLLGVLIGLALLTKLNAVVIVGVALVILIATAIRRRSIRLFALGAASIAVPVVILAGWWFARNQLLYGDPLAWTAFSQIFASVLRKTPLHWVDLQGFFSTQFASFWGVFGWMNVRAPSLLLDAAGVLCLLSLLGLTASFLAGRFHHLLVRQRASLLMLCFAALAWEGYMLVAIIRTDAFLYQGRYIFPVIAPLMLMVGLGLVSLMPQRWATPAGTALAICLASLALLVPFKVIGPAYVTVPLAKWQLWSVPHKTDITFDDMLRLRAYSVDRGEDRSRVSVTLYWQALQKPDFDYSCFVHVVDQSGQVVAQKDQAPGESIGFPPSVWWVGDIVADEHILTLAPDLPVGDYGLRVGLYDWKTGRRLSVTSSGASGSTFVVLNQTLNK